jgi:nucleoside-diphosphate-sugar epimerase
MKVLIIGGNRFVGLRVATALDRDPKTELAVVNRTGQAPHLKNAAIHKCDRRDLSYSHLDRDWDFIFDFAGYDDPDMESSLEYFRKVGRYIFISTVSVYGLGAGMGESDFDAEKFDLSQPRILSDESKYGDGKRRAEAVLAQKAHWPVLRVRFPFILGPDDYSRRLEFHVERIQRGQPLYFPNLGARVSMIHSEDAARFLLSCLQQPLEGPLNVASPEPLALEHLVQKIERASGKKALLVNAPAGQAHSPYGVKSDYYVRTDRLKSLGFTLPAIETWIDSLIVSALIPDGTNRRLH